MRLFRSGCLATFITLAALHAQAEAFQLKVTGFKAMQVGTSREGNFSGFYRRQKHEVVKSLRVVAVANGRIVAGAEAKVRRRRKPKRFTAGVGDFRAQGFALVAEVLNRKTGRTRVLTTRIFR